MQTQDCTIQIWWQSTEKYVGFPNNFGVKPKKLNEKPLQLQNNIEMKISSHGDLTEPLICCSSLLKKIVLGLLPKHRKLAS